jgi:hypothetical protein
MTSKDPLALLALENPVAEDDLPVPGSPAARALVERIAIDAEAEAERRSTVTRRSPRRLTRRMAAAAAAVAFGIALLSALSGDGSLPGRGPEPASAVERAAAVLVGSEDEILHTVTRATRSDDPGRVERTETWEMLAAPHDMRRVTGRGDVTRELATVDGRPQVYLSSENAISTLAPDVELPRGAGRERKLAPLLNPFDGLASFREDLLGLLRSGDAREAGRTTVDGRAAIRIATRLATTMLVAATTYEPIEIRQVFDDGIVVTTRFETFERIPASAANEALLSLRAQHPDATWNPGGITIDPDPPGKGEG